MNVYLYYSKKKINKINRVDVVKKNVVDAINKTFGYIENITVVVNCVRISNDIDVYLVLDTEVNDNAVNNMNKIKNELLKIIQKDQNSNIEYKIRSRIDSKYNPQVELKDSKDMQPRDEYFGEISQEANSELDYEKRSKMYVPVKPSYTFDRVILPSDVLEKIEEALNIVQYEEKVFKEWGLYAIQPQPSSALSFYGASGTGKTMAAEAIADKLGKKILKVSYADIESKFHGEGPKMVKAIFLAAQNEDAVLFIDEADSLLSKRLTNVTQGSEQAINSMRSQLLICLEEFHGIAIFATNLVVNYDQAFLTRLISVEFKEPDFECRKKIWNVHIHSTNGNSINIPLAEDVNVDELAEKYVFCGREIRKAVISACVSVAMRGASYVYQSDFLRACDKILSEELALANAKDNTISQKNLNSEQQSAIKEGFTNIIKEDKVERMILN